MTNKLTSLMAASALVAGLTAVGTAHAGNVSITGAGIYDPATLVATGVENANENASVVEFNATVDGAVQTLYGFCVDLTHSIAVGFDTQAGHDVVSAKGDAQSGVNYGYQSTTLKNDSTGASSGTGAGLSNDQISQIGGLANYGYNLIAAANPSAPGFNSQHLSDELAAVQGAIWSIEYPTSTFTGTGDVETLMGGYVSSAPAWATNGPVNVVYASDGATQGFVIGGVSVPEPTSWALMTAGFGLAGASLRRRRVALAA